MKVNNFKWYAVLVAQKKEFYVKSKLDNAQNNLIKNNINEVLVPIEKEIYEVRRKKVVRNIPVYPGYLFIQADLSNKLINTINEIMYVVRILGCEKPFPIRDEEMDIVKTIADGEKTNSAFKYKIGDVIEVIGGHCKGLSGRVVDILDINLVKVEIQIFNRAIYTNLKLEDFKIA